MFPFTKLRLGLFAAGFYVLAGAFHCAGSDKKTVRRSCAPVCRSGACQNGQGVLSIRRLRNLHRQVSPRTAQGPGAFEFPNGDRFEGHYQDDRRLGEGSYIFKNGNQFHGGFAAAEFQPPATLVFSDGARLSGSFVRQAARIKGWKAGRLPSIQAYGTLRREDEPSRLCAAAGRRLLCDTKSFPGRLTGTALGVPARERFLLVLYSANDTRVRRDGTSNDGRSGMVLRPGDRIEAGKYSIEIQAASGTVLRLKPGSVLRIPLDFGRTGILELERGGILVRTGAKAKKQGRTLRVRSGGTLYSVNGTEFSVETDDTGRISKVKVYAGEIVLSPDVPAMRRFSPAEIEATPALKKILESIDNEPVRVQPGETAGLSEEGRRWTENLNRALKRQKTTSQPGEARMSELERLLEERPAETAGKKEFKETPQEKSERKLLTTVSEDRFEKATDDARDDGDVSADLADDISVEYENNLNRNADDLSGEISSNKPAKSLADLKKIYSTLEVLTFTDGKKKAGSVVAQVGGLLILHSTDGVFRARIKEIRYIDLYHRSDDDGKSPGTK